MNLLRGYPEIEDFFSRNSFTEKELDEFQEEIKKKYTNRIFRQTALALIQLQVLKVKNRKSTPSKKKTKNANSAQTNPDDPKILINYKKNDIASIATTLQISPSLIIRLLSQNDITKSKSEYLSTTDYKVLKDFFKSRIKALKRKEKQHQKTLRSRRKKVKRSLNSKNSVYEKLKKSKVIGKIIYIRKK